MCNGFTQHKNNSKRFKHENIKLEISLLKLLKQQMLPGMIQFT